MIDDAPRAKALARAICSDIVLYNGNVKDAPLAERAGLLAAPLQDGRELFASRVSPALRPIFDEAVASIITPHMGVAIRSTATPMTRSARAPATPSPALAQPVVESGGSNMLVLMVTIGLLAAAAAAAAIFFVRGQ